MSKRFKNNNFFQISGWMINDLDLGGTKLMIYAIIYGFSQDNDTEFSGSIGYLCEGVGASRPTVIKYLKELVEEGYLNKYYRRFKNQDLPVYKCKMEIVEEVEETKPTKPKIVKREKTKTSDKSEFKETLVDLGVHPDHAEDWIKTRKIKKGSLTKTVINKLVRECEENDFSIADAVRICAENSWQGFKYSWLKEKNKNGKKAATYNRREAIEKMAD